jgi:hypothetical protein
VKKIHSEYNPEREAERYIAQMALQESIKYFILLECGICYVIPYLRQRNRNAKIISLHISADYISSNSFVPPQNIPDAEWSPESKISCSDFLEKEIEDIESDKIKIIEWRPALSLGGEKYLALLKEAARFIKWTDANKRTITHFSSRWQRNARKNRDIAQRGFHPVHSNKKNIIICASGPGLENDIDIIKEMKAKNGSELLAVSSAYSALIAHNIVPDIMITSDGGNWARFHLYEAARFSGNMLVVATLHAALLSDFSTFPLLLFSDGTDGEEKLLEGAPILHWRLPARGTVTANAIDFALRWTEGDVYITGLDLANNDICSHARPYSFDMLLWQKSNRFNPYYHEHYKRARAIEEGGAYTLYNEWFKKELPKYSPRLFFLSGNYSVE